MAVFDARSVVLECGKCRTGLVLCLPGNESKEDNIMMLKCMKCDVVCGVVSLPKELNSEDIDRIWELFQDGFLNKVVKIIPDFCEIGKPQKSI